MSVTKKELAQALKELQPAITTAITNARRSVRFRRVRNEDEIPTEEFIEEGEEDAGGEGDLVLEEPLELNLEIPEGTDLTEEDLVVVPADEVADAGATEEEIYEEAPAEEEIYEEEEEPVQNYRRRVVNCGKKTKKYRKVKNAKIVRNDHGDLDILVPIEERRVTNVRRYKTRAITRNEDGLDVSGTYAKTIQTPGIAKVTKASENGTFVDNARLAALINKAHKYDRAVLKNDLNQELQKMVKEVVGKSLTGSNSGTQTSMNFARTGKKAPAKSKTLRFDNGRYRAFKNEDGSVSIEINVEDGQVVDDAPVPVDIAVEGDALPIGNRRVQAAVNNSSTEYVDMGVLEAPSTFPEKTN